MESVARFRVIWWADRRRPTFVPVYVSVSAPEKWQTQVRRMMESKLDAMPDVQVVARNDDAVFTVSLDVNELRDSGDSSTLGYSLSALVYGTYDQKIMKTFLEAAERGVPAEARSGLQFMKYVASGNVFLSGVVHTIVVPGFQTSE